MRDPVLAVDGARVELDAGVTALPETTLSVAAGERVAVRGPNGAGKTTLLRVLAGRQRPTVGRATLDGHRLDERRDLVRRKLAVLLEPPTLYPDLTLVEQIELVHAAWTGATEQPWPGLGADALEVFGIGDLAARFPHELSSGQRQLTSLAVTFARPATVLLLDEPEQRLDEHRRGIVADAIARSARSGAAVVFASHAPELVARSADRTVWVGA